MKKIVITTGSFGVFDDTPIKMVKEKGYEVILNPYGRTVKPYEFVELAHDAIGVIAGTERIDKASLCQLKQLKAISRCGAGMDNLDVVSAKELGIQVMNTPDAPTLAVAELTVALILNILRKVSLMDRELRANLWKKRMGNLLCQKKVGIIGLGRIGKKAAELLKAFGCDISYYDNYVDDKNFKKLSLMDLLGWSDIVTIHVSSSGELLGQNELNAMKEGAWLINTSRGGVVNEKELHEFLKNKKLSGAALDVFEAEPYDKELRELDNIILTPHIGSYAKEARINMEIQSAENLLKLLK